MNYLSRSAESKYVSWIFPKTYHKKPQVRTYEQAYSADAYTSQTKYIIPNIIRIFKANYPNIYKPNIIDATAGIGGSTVALSLSNEFNEITAYEINKFNYETLAHNLSCFKHSSPIKILNKNSIALLSDKFNSDKYDIITINPPWGGKKYLEKDNIDLPMHNYDDILEFCNDIRVKTKLFVLYLPINYNYKNLKKYPKWSIEYAFPVYRDLAHNKRKHVYNAIFIG
jgi:16S rRNA G966 N2-methylase RsmD